MGQACGVWTLPVTPFYWNIADQEIRGLPLRPSIIIINRVLAARAQKQGEDNFKFHLLFLHQFCPVIAAYGQIFWDLDFVTFNPTVWSESSSLWVDKEVKITEFSAMTLRIDSLDHKLALKKSN